jgi:fructose-1,6-bisphosphatase I
MTPLSSTPSNLGPSLGQFLKEEQQKFRKVPEELLCIFAAIIAASKVINEVVRKLGLMNIIGAQGTYNSSNEAQQKLDMLAHHCFLDALAETGEVCALLSEEEEGIIPLPNKSGKYIVALDPLDGSPNIDVNAPIGTIFSVYQRCSHQSLLVQQEDILQKGSEQLAAGYILYGTSTMFVYTVRHGVHSFTYHPAADDFFLAHETMQLPKSGQYYAINDGYFDAFPSYVQHYIQQCRRHEYSARYMGALIADFHRHLIQGGIYLYPSTKKHPAGKLRLVLECNALALIAEEAGGTASNGQQSILSLLPQAIHQRVPLYIGSTEMVKNLLEGAV